MSTQTKLPRLYTAGGIAGLSDEEMNGWRDRVTRELNGLYEMVHPTRRDYRRTAFTLPPSEVVLPDIRDIASCQTVLVNCTRPSWGTAMEMVYAWRYCQDVWPATVFVIAFGHGALSPWVKYHSHVQTDNLEEAIETLRAIGTDRSTPVALVKQFGR